jgi:hypothetical protein
MAGSFNMFAILDLLSPHRRKPLDSRRMNGASRPFHPAQTAPHAPRDQFGRVSSRRPKFDPAGTQ